MLEFSMLLVNNNRSKAYLQNLILKKYKPEHVILLSDNTRLPEQTDNDVIMKSDSTQKNIRSIDELSISFDEKEQVLATIIKNNIDYTVINNLDINSKDVINAISLIPSKYVIYSGPGGSLLKKEILNQGVSFIHVHPGWLPTYRGSTTIYYSMLVNSEVGASVIIFEEGIDEGPILYKRRYQISQKNIDYDYVLDPLIRANTLMEFMMTNKLNAIQQNPVDQANTFYIVHPFIKHAAILAHNR